MAKMFKVKEAFILKEIPQIEKDIIAKKNGADYRILDIGNTRTKNIYVWEKNTNKYFWMGEKQELALRAAGKIFETDF